MQLNGLSCQYVRARGWDDLRGAAIKCRTEHQGQALTLGFRPIARRVSAHSLAAAAMFSLDKGHPSTQGQLRRKPKAERSKIKAALRIVSSEGQALHLDGPGK